MTEVFILGSIHGFHLFCPGYSFLHLKKLVAAFGPDLVCVEIRPEHFAVRDFSQYPPDMKVAVEWADSNIIALAAIDWWEDGGRQAHEAALKELQSTEAGREQMKRLKDAEQQVYCGDFGELINTYAKAHSSFVQDIFRRKHAIETDILGEGPLNLWWEQRNDIMAERLLQAVHEHSAQRVVVVTGCEHKYALEDRISGQPGIRLLQLEDFLTEPIILTAEEQEKLADDQRRLEVFQAVDGPQANSKPDSVDLDCVLPKVEEYLRQNPENTEMLYYRGLCHYIAKDYDSALADFRQAATDYGARLLLGALVHDIALLRTGQMLDLLGKREQAIQQYHKVIHRGSQFTSHAKAYLDKPFSRPK